MNTTTTPQTNHISTVRMHLLDQLAAIRGAKGDDVAIELERSKGVADIAQVIVNTAKVEVDYLRATNQTHTPFLEVPATIQTGNQPQTPSITRNNADDIKPVVKRTNWVGMTQ